MVAYRWTAAPESVRGKPYHKVAFVTLFVKLGRQAKFERHGCSSLCHHDFSSPCCSTQSQRINQAAFPATGIAFNLPEAAGIYIVCCLLSVWRLLHSVWIPNEQPTAHCGLRERGAPAVAACARTTCFRGSDTCTKPTETSKERSCSCKMYSISAML